jgi:hypothetical protein
VEDPQEVCLLDQEIVHEELATDIDGNYLWGRNKIGWQRRWIQGQGILLRRPRTIKANTIVKQLALSRLLRCVNRSEAT